MQKTYRSRLNADTITIPNTRITNPKKQHAQNTGACWSSLVGKAIAKTAAAIVTLKSQDLKKADVIYLIVLVKRFCSSVNSFFLIITYITAGVSHIMKSCNGHLKIFPTVW